MAAIPFLKKIEFLSADGTPTEHYRNFRARSQRNKAIRHALRAGFPDIYKQTDFAESAKDDKISDIVIALTGRSKSDQTVRAILGSFKVLAELMTDESEEDTSPQIDVQQSTQTDAHAEKGSTRNGFNLGYQINIILPDTKDVEVFDAIFKKLKEHLL